VLLLGRASMVMIKRMLNSLVFKKLRMDWIRIGSDLARAGWLQFSSSFSKNEGAQGSFFSSN